MKKILISLLLLTALAPLHAQNTIQIKRGLQANLPALLPGQLAFTTDTRNLYVGQTSGGNWLVTGTGPAGPAGAAGPQGASGTNGINGTNGTNGAAGSQIYVGTGAPGAGLGVDGDLYLNSATGDVYKHSSGNWGSAVANIKGPQGSAGPAGSAGVPGATGTAGTNGTNGTNGAPGAAGPVGPNYPLQNAGTTLTSAPTSLNFASGATVSGNAVTYTPPTSLPPSGAAGGDLTGSYPSPTLSASGITAGSYGFGHSAAVDAKGRITGAANPTGTASSTTFLRGDGSWATPAGGGGATALSGLSDVTISSPAAGQYLIYNSSTSKWNNSPVTPGIVVSPGVGYQQLLQVAQGYQVAPGSASLFSAPLLADSNTASGYLGGALGITKTTTNTTNMVTRWLLNATSGTTEPDSVTTPTNDLTITGTPTFGTDTNAPYIQFASGCYASTSAALLPGTGDFSVVLAINDNTAVTYADSIRVETPGNSAYAVFTCQVYSSSTVRKFILFSAGNSYTISDNNRTNGLAQYAYTWQASTNTATLYKNGTQIAQSVFSGVTRTDGTGRPTYIGNNAANTSAGASFPHYFASFYTRLLSSSEAAAQYSGMASAGSAGNCAVMDAGTFGVPGFSQVVLTRAWANTLTEVLEYSSNGTTWTAVPTGYAAPNNGGTLSTVSTTVSLTGIGNPRYLRYSGKDSGGTTGSFRLFEVRPS